MARSGNPCKKRPRPEGPGSPHWQLRPNQVDAEGRQERSPIQASSVPNIPGKVVERRPKAPRTGRDRKARRAWQAKSPAGPRAGWMKREQAGRAGPERGCDHPSHSRRSWHGPVQARMLPKRGRQIPSPYQRAPDGTELRQPSSCCPRPPPKMLMAQMGLALAMMTVLYVTTANRRRQGFFPYHLPFSSCSNPLLRPRHRLAALSRIRAPCTADSLGVISHYSFFRCRRAGWDEFQGQGNATSPGNGSRSAAGGRVVCATSRPRQLWRLCDLSSNGGTILSTSPYAGSATRPCRQSGP
jgi:hypothetical protein